MTKNNNSDLLYKLSIINNNIDIVALLDELGIKYNLTYKRNGREISMCCPFHKERTPSFNYNVDTHLYKCWGASCKKTGFGFTKIYSALKGISFVDALNELLSFCPQNLIDSDKNIFVYNSKKQIKQKVVKKKKTQLVLPAEYELINYETDNCYWNYLKKRKITKEIINLYSIGFCDTGYYCGRIIIPIDFNGETVAFIARRIDDDEMFFKKISEFERLKGYRNKISDKKVAYPKDVNIQEYLFGYDYTIKHEPLIVVEGIFDLFSVLNSGYTNVVANNGTFVSQINALRYREYPELWAIPDKDDKSDGYALYDALLEAGANRKIKIIEIPDNCDPGSVDNLANYIVNKNIAKNKLPIIHFNDGKKI